MTLTKLCGGLARERNHEACGGTVHGSLNCGMVPCGRACSPCTCKCHLPKATLAPLERPFAFQASPKEGAEPRSIEEAGR